MNHEAVHDVLGELARIPGVVGAAVVDAGSGMTWYHAGVLPQLERFGEAAVEFWRVQLRLADYFSTLGAPQSAAFSCERGVVAIFPCRDDPPLVLVCVADRKDVPWKQCAEPVARLKQLLALTATAASANVT